MNRDEVIAILNSVDVEKDKFELDDDAISFAFPCWVCKYRTGPDTEEPCSFCGHNSNCSA